MPCLPYCVTRTSTDALPSLVGVCDEVVRARDSSGLRVYWSEIADPEVALAEGVALKTAAAKFQQVLRAIVLHVTPVPFHFPVVLSDFEAVDAYIAERGEVLCGALSELGDTVQYEMIASWAADDQTDLATPVSGREYLKRRQEAADRIAAIDQKLKTVTGEHVREWRVRQDRRKHHWFALVLRQDRERFVAALRSAGPSAGVRLRLSGPWPPGEFVALQQEAG